MKNHSLLLLFLALSWPFCAVAAEDAPLNIEKESYLAWLAAVGAPADPYAEVVFGWNAKEQARPIPKEALADRENIFVNVSSALADCDAAEKAGDVEVGTTFGLDAYAVIPAPIAAVLKTSLFRWGKPLNAEGGVTRHHDSIYAVREDRMELAWGQGAYRARAIRKNGGLAADQDDYYTVLVRGDEKDGYVIVGGFLKAAGPSATKSYISITRIRPLEGGKTDYRLTGRYTGQSYAGLGPLSSVRKQYGFNAGRIREEIRGFINDALTLVKTGSIPQEKK